MKINLNSTADKIHPLFWQLLCFAIPIGFFGFVLVNRHPGVLRELSISSRIDFIPIIPILALAVYFCYLIPGRIGELVSFAGTMFLFALPLAGLWASGHTHTTALNGVIPLTDAAGYYIDALRLTNGLDFSVFAARRPFFAGFLAVLLSITNYNLMVSLAIFTGLVGITAYYASKEVEKTHGTEVSVFFLMMVFIYFRLHSGINMTENLGVILGLLGFSMLWNGAENKKPLLVYFGLFTTTLALNARAGALFTLPLFSIWVGWIFRKQNRIPWKPFFISAFTIALGFGCNLVLTKTVASPEGVPFSNFSYSFYGLASGGNSWAFIYEAHPEVFSLPVQDQPGKIYQLAFELIKSKPSLIIQGAIFNWKILFSDTLYSLYSYVAHENWPINPIVKWLLYTASILGLYSCVKNFDDPLNSFIVAGAVGIFISVPFAQPIDAFRMRPYAANVPNLVIIPALGLGYILKKTRIRFFNKPTQTVKYPIKITVLSSLLISVMLFGPVFIKYTSGTKTLITTNTFCSSPKTPVIMRLDNGSFINIHNTKADFTDWAPDFHIKLFRREAHSLSSSVFMEWTKTVPPLTTLLLTLDRYSGNGTLIVLPTVFTNNASGTYFELCGRYEQDPSLIEFIRIFYAEKVKFLDR